VTPRDELVRETESGSARCQLEVVEVGRQPMRSTDARDDAIRRVDDDPLSFAEPVARLSLPPGENRPATELLHLEVGDDLVRDRVEPDELAPAVEDHRAALTGA
jgi:hypothetical protein